LPIALRPIEPADVTEAGRICHDAFKAIAGQHNFPPDFREPEVAIDLLSRLTANLGFYGVVAERDGRVVGSNFVDERSPIIGLGPITVDPAAQNQGVGAALMQHMVGRAAATKLQDCGWCSRVITFARSASIRNSALRCASTLPICRDPQSGSIFPAAWCGRLLAQMSRRATFSATQCTAMSAAGICAMRSTRERLP
jgi:GNAT superfamily N-acetyltransferase